MLKVQNLTKTYSGFKALDNVSFTIKKGQITGFLGPNGAGKTTTLRILTSFLLPDSGKVSYDDRSLQPDSKSLLKEIGYLPENNPLYDELRVDELLAFTAKMKGEEDMRKVGKLAKQCGLEDKLDKKIETLSKGYKQRVGLTKALIGDPKYLILDEPTEGLDPNQKDEILKLIKKVSENKTIIFSSHVLSEVTKIADKIIIINKGKIAAEGKKDQLLKKHFKKAKIEIKTDAKVRQLTKALEESKLVKDVKLIKKAKFSTYEVTCTKPEEAAVYIFDTIVKNKWKLSQIHTVSQGLEDLFKQLTT